MRQTVVGTAIVSLLLLAACRTAAPSRPPTPAATPTAARSEPAAVEEKSDRRARWLEMFARGYFPGRSGQVFYVPHEGDFLIDKDPLYTFMHGSPWDYDTRIPLFFYGPGFVREGRWPEPVSQQDVVPTLAALLQIAPPATTTGRALLQALQTGNARPRVVTLFVLDGMRADYFDTYADAMPTLIRWRAEGAAFSNARLTSLPSATSIGHATLGTGTDPRIHGLVVNRLFNRVSGASQESYNNLDPGELMALTLADVWNIATDGRAVIVGQGGAIRATAGLVGHGACLVNGRRVIAASYAAREAGGWETNPTCYTMSPALKSLTAERYWKEAGGMWMGHDIASAARFRASGLFQRFEGDALAAVLEEQPLGADDVTDLVLVNFKGPDYTSHAYGPSSREIRETLAELDRQLARAMQIITKKAGPNRTVVAVAADHGMPGEPPPGRRRITTMEVVEALNQRFSPQPPSIVQFFTDAANAQIHLDTARVAALGFTLKDVAAFLESKLFLAAFTEDEVRAAQARLAPGL
jgi:Type I phosphodiesterase / nucleotide pyrophosphatase